MNNSPAVSYIKDETGRFVYASRHLSELFNVPLEDIYGKLDADFLPKEAALEIRRKEQRIIKSGEMEEMLDDILMLDGKIHTWQSYKFPVEDGFGGHLVGGMSFDINERRQMEELLLKTTTVQRAILNSANYTLISTDADGIIQTFNRTAEKWLGYTAEEIVGKQTPAIIHVAEEVEARAQALTEELGHVVEPGFEAFVAKTRVQTVDEREWTYLRKDGTHFPVLLSITALRDEKGEIIGFLGIGSDITERRQMEADLKKARDAAVESARMKSEFLANMSHEIRTPMNGIVGMTEIILDSSLDDLQRSCAETIRDSSDALLTFGNAVKFTTSGEIIVRVEKLSETDTSSRLRFSVSDTGIGISPEAQKYLFQAFTQADGSTTRKFGGTGLGLTISKQLIEMMNGEINVESAPDKGSTFSFTAEFEKQIAGGIETNAPRRDLQNVRVLIVDDNSANRKILLHQTTSLGMIADEAADGATALRLLENSQRSNNSYDVAILDLVNSEMDGFEIARRIKSDNSFGDVRLIIMSSFGQRGHGRTAREIGIAGYLIKPVKQAELFDCITSVMGEKNTFAQAGGSAPLVTRHTLEELCDNRPTRILVAEDNPVNQTLAILQLERLGYRADVVANGRLAVQVLKRGNYSLILMDCQMPEMDGYAAAAEIRRSERDGQHIPVIAVTANAMQGIREKCLASGMDDYLAKPFKQHELDKIIKRWVKHDTIVAEDFARVVMTQEKGLISRSSNDAAKTELFQTVQARLNELEAEIGTEEVRMIVGLFRQDSAVRFEHLQKAIAEENVSQVEFESHCLKGGCGNIGAASLAELCARIESEAKSGRLSKSSDLIKKITLFYRHLIELLDELQP